MRRGFPLDDRDYREECRIHNMDDVASCRVHVRRCLRLIRAALEKTLLRPWVLAL